MAAMFTRQQMLRPMILRLVGLRSKLPVLHGVYIAGPEALFEFAEL